MVRPWSGCGGASADSGLLACVHVRKEDTHENPELRRRGRGDRRGPRAAPAFAQSRDQIRIVGSSTVFPYTQAVAEQFAGMTGIPAPVVESTGTGGGMQIFCGGVGPSFPDITGASRAMKDSEYETCAANGVDNVTEVLIGYDGLSIAQSVDGPDLDLTKAAALPGARRRGRRSTAQIVANPYTTWSEIDPSLPDDADPGLRPAADLGHPRRLRRAGDARGCAAFPAIAALDEAAHGRGLRSGCARTARSSRPARTTT